MPRLSREQLARHYSSNLYDYAEDIVGYKDMYRPFHDDVMCRFLTEWKPGKNIKLLLVSRGHFKSSLASITLPLYTWTQPEEGGMFPGLLGQDTRILLSHGKRDTGVKYLRETRGQLLHNDLYPTLWPHVFYDKPNKQSPVWHTDEINVKRVHEDKVPSLLVSGTDSSVVGLHFHLLIFDDLVFKENVGTPEMRRKTLEYLQESMALLRLGGKVIILGTRWHWDDMYSILLDPHGPYRDTVDCLVSGSGYTEGKPVFPVSATGRAGFSMERLGNLRETMKDKFWSQYENSPRSGDSGIFSRGDILLFDALQDGSPPVNGDINYFTAIDPNRSVKTKDDPCVVMTAGVDSRGHIWVVDISRGHPTGIEIVEWIRSHVSRWNPLKVIVEANNFQLQLSHWLREDQLKHQIFYPIQEVVRGPTTKKFDRITAIQPLVQAKGLHVRRGYDSLISEMEYYPDWKNDDQCDALADIYAFGYKSKETVIQKEVPSSPFLLKNLVGDMFEHNGNSDQIIRRF